MLAGLAAVAAATGGCPSHSVAAPADATFDTRCAWTTEGASSIFACVEKCAADGGVPACPNSTAEYAWLAETIVDRVHWLGLYQPPGAGEPTSSWDRCVSGGGVNFTNWAAGEPNHDMGQSPESCAHATVIGAYDETCVLPESTPCVCTPGAASDAWPADAVALRRQHEEWLELLRPQAVAAFGVALAVALAAITAFVVADAPVRRALCSGCHAGRGPPSLSKGASAAEVRLASSLDEATRLRVRVSLALRAVGTLVYVIGLAPTVRMMTGTNLHLVVGHPLYWAAFAFPGVFLAAASILPTDVTTVRVFTVFVFALCLAFSVLLLFASVQLFEVDFSAIIAYAMAPIFLLMSIALAPTLRFRTCPPRAALRRLWLVGRLGLFSLGIVQGIEAIRLSVMVGIIDPGLIALAVSLFLFPIYSAPAVRGRLIRWLGSLGKSGNERQKAAAIAAIVGNGADAHAVLETAKALFRCVRVSRLEPGDLADSGLKGPRATASTTVAVTSAEDLAKKTEAAVPGEVDAFFSHSWRDEETAPGKKFEALARWAAKQGADRRSLSSEASDPTIWLDKACINQDNVDKALLCLPVFLASCKGMLCVAGESYTKRLWCVVEVSWPHRLCARLLSPIPVLRRSSPSFRWAVR